MNTDRSGLALTMPGNLYAEASLHEVDNLEALLGMTSTPDLRTALEAMRPGVTEGMPSSRVAFLVLLAWMVESGQQTVTAFTMMEGFKADGPEAA